MANPKEPTPPGQKHEQGHGYLAGPTNLSEVSAALLELLRKVNAEVPAAPALEGSARDAVLNFQRISRDLATVRDKPTTSPR